MPQAIPTDIVTLEGRTVAYALVVVDEAFVVLMLEAISASQQSRMISALVHLLIFQQLSEYGNERELKNQNKGTFEEGDT
jgi:hypothetical protein